MSSEEQQKSDEQEVVTPQDETQTQPTQDSQETTVEAPGLEEEVLKWRESSMRLAAEYDNYRKRMVKEKEECIKYANQRLLEELLPIIDHFEMGLSAASADSSSMIFIGMNMVKKQLDEFLSSNGVQAVDPAIGSAYDHATQEAIQREPSDMPEGSIIRVIRKGYTLKGRLIRPANVVVAQGEEHE